MRLWHYKLLPSLDNRRLIRQHCECCALRGNGWGRKHATVDYVFRHSPLMLYSYHLKVMTEMHRRGYLFDTAWLDMFYRGKEIGKDYGFYGKYGSLDYADEYPEHDEAYYELCVNKLIEKGAKPYDKDSWK